MSYDENGIPIVPESLQLYDSFKQDPPFAKAFTYTWVSVAVFCVLISSPRIARSIKTGRLWAALRGVGEDYGPTSYESIDTATSSEKHSSGQSSRRPATRLRGWMSALAGWSLYEPPFLRLDVGQIILLLGYLSTLLACILKDAQLRTNANRAGFLAVAQLPLVFLLATKNNILATLMGRGYEKLNFLHRWSGRAIFLSATIHGALWIQSHLRIGVKFNQDKEMRGLAAYAILCLIVLTSVKPVRKLAYQFFFMTHIVGFIAFFVLVCYHTPYAQPWIFPAIAFYALDMLMRLFRFRFKPATLSAPDSQITFINVDGCDFGWVAGQHVRVRALYGGRVFESHALSICNAPANISTISSSHGQIFLAARVVGDWTRSLNAFAQAIDDHSTEEQCCDDKLPEQQITVMLDGPYGGISFDLGTYEHVLLVAGGAGITFTLGVLDDLVGRIVRLGRPYGERTNKIELAWCIKSFGAIKWFASQLDDVATAAAKDPSLELHIKFFVTCLCDPEQVPDIPNSEATMEKPSIADMLDEFVSGASHGTGGIGIAASGPHSLVSEARNTVAKLGLRAARVGGVALHTEVFCL
ncbi:SubName: Full=Related to ferric reductase (Metalloreductase) {ECO:0000313/EMBL:CCA71821.1} [Serendipita indica DSM 11827]|uniref:Related to ferric reductase (Metalloreductase) n=1 Tax=Serendipita indica (strain DSM 11827) TaxID=1109443 RepID=G4TKH8_SERID|nr:SubName: Full=Related to ferric reductase (Metalloreductase) {ECO:0000313/EMBL:CCA71821.1} [Serendipita indica DSM 11827]CCA71821.1 related to ferric reductase (metalloreductase) [Serendipita indica DSM 11827]